MLSIHQFSKNVWLVKVFLCRLASLLNLRYYFPTLIFGQVSLPYPTCTGYGLLMFLAAVQTVRFARKKNFRKHRAWALRLFALAIGSWLYRMDYGFYIGFGGREGHTENFTGWFDYFMDFWFYLPNLLVVEIILAEYPFFQRPWVKIAGGTTLLLASAFLLFASFFFIRDYWGPGILGGL